MNRIDLDTLRSWTGTDADLARHCGVTRQAIHHARLTHGIPAPINGRVGPRHGLGRTLCTAVIREATRRAGSLADDAVRLDAIRAVLDDLNAWHKGEVGSDAAARAALIAAAPDLLEACEVLLDAVVRRDHKDKALRTARAAIAKAKGQSSSTDTARATE